MKKLAVVVTHPIQYYAPIFQLLAKQTRLMVFYTWGESALRKYDPGFGKIIEWDLPLLEGYPYQFEKNTAKKPGSHHFNGIQNPDLLKNLKDFDPDALLIFGWAYASHLKAIRHFKGKIPVWFRGDSTLLDETKGMKSLAKPFLLRWIYSYIDLAFYVGQNNKHYFLKYGLKENQVAHAPHAIDNQRFAEYQEIEAQGLRTQLGVKLEDKLILFAGKLEPKKDPFTLLEAFGMVECEGEKQYPVVKTANKQQTTNNKRQIHLLFVGNGVLEESLKLKVKTSELKSVHFMDFQNQSRMPVIYQAADLFCLPSKGPGETWGLAINEAMAAGKAVIASDKAGGALDLIVDGENGYLFPAGNTQILADQLLKLLGNDDLLKEYGKCSAERIQTFTFESICSSIVEELNNL
jgi:glycosyltransferase involved in cell wall biosynthesis